jgi:internalin A
MINDFFNLSQDKIEKKIDKICKSYNLEKLYLDNKQLNKLPPEFGNLLNLQYLDLDVNKLNILPVEILKIY